jgi:hypothetical protein
MRVESPGRSVFARQGGWFAAFALLTWACAQGSNGVDEPSNGNGGTSSSGGTAGKSAGGSSGSSSSGGTAGTSSFGGSSFGGSASGGTAGSSGAAGSSGSAGTAGSAGSAGSGGTAGAGGTSGAGGTAGSGGTSGSGGGGSGGTGGTDEPSFGGAGSLDDCNADSVDDDVGEQEQFTGPADSCISLTVTYGMTKLFLAPQPGTTDDAYPITFDYASCIGSGSGEFTADYVAVYLYGTSSTKTIPNPNCKIYVKFNGESGKTVSFYHYG